MYTYKRSIKSSLSDELLNTWLLRPLAGLIVRLVYPTSITPNQVTIASTVVGLIGAGIYLVGTHVALACAGLCITLKDVLDCADGQLARAKNQFSREGRFLDSIGDFAVNAAAFSAIAWVVFSQTAEAAWIVLSASGLLGISLRVSYHVFYQVQYLHLHRSYENNRVSEELTEHDLRAERRTVMLQRVFQWIYAWQDRLVARVDRWCRSDGALEGELAERWYGDVPALRLSGLIGLGTELFLLMICSVAGDLKLYLWLNAVGMNGILLLNIFYRRMILRRRLSLRAL